jgi:DNA polymerase-3 subunit delta
MIKNLVLLTGEDSYRLSARLKFYKQKFREIYADGEIVLFEKEHSYADLENSVFTPNLFGGKRLIICDNFWNSEKYEKAEKKKFFTKLPDYEAECSLLVVAPKLDKRLKFSKFLIANARTEKFEKFAENEVIRWIEKFTEQNEGIISRENARKLWQRCGDDLWTLSSEIKKLIFAENSREISWENIEKLTQPNPQLEIWDFLKNLSQCNAPAAIGKFRDLLTSGTPVQMVFSMIQREIRVHAQLVDGISRNLSEREIATETRLHPFVVKKTLPLSRNFSREKIVAMYDTIFDIDMKIKTGGISTTSTDAGELELAVEKFIVKFCS